MASAAAPITPATWDASGPVAAVLAPAQAGVVQALTLQGLPPGETFFALRAEDEVGNVSPVGNSPSVVVP